MILNQEIKDVLINIFVDEWIMNVSILQIKCLIRELIIST